MYNEREVAVFESWEVVSSIACQSVYPVFNSKFELFIERQRMLHNVLFSPYFRLATLLSLMG